MRAAIHTVKLATSGGTAGSFDEALLRDRQMDKKAGLVGQPWRMGVGIPTEYGVHISPHIAGRHAHALVPSELQPCKCHQQDFTEDLLLSAPSHYEQYALYEIQLYMYAYAREARSRPTTLSLPCPARTAKISLITRSRLVTR